ncbi:MAG: TRAP transporter substrate-binding protein DctP [Rhizobiaceae bacterium]|nr:TRAP transporter substrate-binding protein DctP [Rhizobiaceae bacterium]
MKNLLALAAAGMTLWAAPAFSQEVTIRFPVEYSLEITPGAANKEFKQIVEERSNGRIEVKFFPSGSLYRGLDLVQAILRGDAEMTTLISAYWSALAPRSAVSELPYAFPTKQSFYNAIDDKFFERVYAETEEKGATVIGILPFDYLVPGTRETPLVKPEDMAGLKFRGLGKVNLAMLQKLNAKPVSINFGEISPAIQQGLIDGLNVPTDSYTVYKWQESIRHVTYAPYYMAFYPWTVNTAWWNGLDPELRGIIQTAATEVAEKHRKRSEEASDQALEDLRNAGVAVHMQTEAERDVWMEATSSVWTEFESQIGTDLMGELQSYSK